MKTSIRILIPLALGLLSLCMGAFVNAQSSVQEYCWRDSYGRGVGTIPTSCNEGDYDAGLCYNKCRPGYTGVGPVCWSACPAGYKDHGWVCHIDKPLTKGVDWRCTAWWPDWLGGGCRWKDSYCSDGDYENIGLFCALKSAGKSPPPGFSGTYLDPMKNSYGRGVGTPANCGSKEYDAGLCYTKCDAGYNGVGPVCWGKSPSNWVDCGMGSAKNSTVCGMTTFSQVASVGQLAYKIATAGATQPVEAAAQTGRLAELRQKFQALKDLYNASKISGYVDKAAIAGKAGVAGYNAIETMRAETVTEEDILRVSAQIAAIVDPSGVAGVVGSYSYPKCSKYFGATAAAPAPAPAPAFIGCQQMSDTYGTNHGVTWGTAPEALQKQWIANNCSTRPSQRTGGLQLNWVAGPGVPGNAVIGGQEPGRQLAVCRASHQGGVHPGKVVAGKCNIGWGGREIEHYSFEVLTNSGASLSWVAGPGVPGNAVIGGQEPGRQLAVCRATHQGGVHPGKVVAGKCNIGWGGREIELNSFEVLVKQ